MKYEGDKEDLTRHVLLPVGELFVIKLDGKIYKVHGPRATYASYNKAKGALRKAMEGNFHQGHYWHKGKDNTFSKNGGHMRNGGYMAGLDKEFKKLAIKFTDQLLEDKIFVIEKIN